MKDEVTQHSKEFMLAPAQFHQTQAEAQVTDIAFLVLPQPMALTGCVHSSSFQKVALGGHTTCSQKVRKWMSCAEKVCPEKQISRLW